MILIINEHDFVEAIESMQRVDEYQEAKNHLYKKFNADGYLIEPDNNATVLRLLNILFSDCTEVDAINVFCLENHYGVGKKNQIYEDSNGQKITLSSPAELYQYLVKNTNTGE